MEEVLHRARAESWSERWVREYVARRRRTREPPPRRCRRCPARDVRLCWGRGSRPPNFERRRERRERGVGVRVVAKKGACQRTGNFGIHVSPIPVRVVSMRRKDGTWKEVHAKNNNSWRGARAVARARTHLPHGLCRTPL